MSIASAESVIEDVVSKFVCKRKYGVCLIASALVVHRLDNGEVIEGYLVFDSHQCYIRHYWCRIDGKDYDIGTLINTRLEIAHIPSRLSQVAPENYTYMSTLDQEELRDLEKGYQLYLSNRRKFWKSSRMGWLKKLL